MVDSKTEIEEYIKKEIAKSGFPLEITTSMTLSKHDWVVYTHAIFYSEENKNYREIDIRAWKSNKWIKDAGDILVVECKKQEEKPWVFFEQDEPNTNVLTLNLVPSHLYGMFEKSFKKHYYFNRKPCSYHFPSFVSGKRDSTLEAINQVLDGLNFCLEQELHVSTNIASRMRFLYPVIILDGKLFSARIETEGNIRLSESKHLQLKVVRASRKPELLPISKGENIVTFIKEYIIDVVRKDYFEQFLANF